MGKSLRVKCPRRSHATWQPAENRPDPVALVKESSKGRISKLIPIRYGRMVQSPFTFFRGAALNMAADLASTPTTGLHAHVCGDCHLLNFGAFATPERREIFDINDLDETLRAPWEWDVKRLTASFVLACRDNGFSEDCARDAVLSCAGAYRTQMREFSQMRALDLWYTHLDVQELIPTIHGHQARKRAEKQVTVAHKRSVHDHEFPKLATVVGRLPRIKDNPPLIYHWRERGHDDLFAEVHAAFAGYRNALRDDRKALLDRYRLLDIAIKVVGVGSVGTWCGIALLLASEHDPLFLQIKEANASVLERFAGKSPYPNHGQRVVNGYRFLQSASDLFLGWTVGPKGRHFYVRQLNDTKVKPLVDEFSQSDMLQYAEICGRTVAKAHARSGQPAEISGYLGKSDGFDQAIADFSIAYADQTERDHKCFVKAVRAGTLKVEHA